MKGFAPIAAGLILSACAHSTAPTGDAETAMISVIEAQQAAWNTGDITGFMAGYIEDETLRFASGGTVTRGWQSTHDRYQARYSDRAIMGELVFSDLEASRLSPDSGVVHGRWQLVRENDAPWGLFTLIFRKVDGQWVIVSDTTTSAD